MLTKTSRTAVILAFILSAVILGAADTANELKLQQGIDLLESKGDLARATPLFEQASRSSDRAVASRALLYLGGIQERQGREAARATYERILKDFGNQEAAVEARKRLVAIGVAIGVAPSDNVAYTRLIEVFDDAASLSSDGLSMAGIDWDDSGDIAIQDVATGKLRRLLAKPAVADDPWDAYGQWASLSPDQSKVLFLWDPAEKEAEYQLRVMANKPGSPSRTLFEINDEITWIANGVWFPDGQSALIQTESKNREWQLVRVGVADKSFQVIKSLQWRLQGVEGRPSISPDGKYIAYAALANNPSKAPATSLARRVRPTAPDSADQYIYLLPADGSGQETPVARTAGINEAPVWTPDGSHIVFISDRSVGARTSGFGLWSVEISNGRANGAPSPVRPDLGRVVPIGMTNSGSYHYFQRDSGGMDVFVADMPPGLKTQGAAVRLSETATNSNGAPAWSHDGKRVAFKRQRRGAPAPASAPRVFDLVVYTVATGDERVFASNNMSTDRPIWSHDGKYVFTKSNQTVLRFDLETRQSRSIEAIVHSALPSGMISFALSPDDKTLYIATQAPISVPNAAQETKLSITAFDLTTGEQRSIYSTLGAPLQNSIALSPDGRTLALLSRTQAKGTRLTKISVDIGKAEDLGPAASGTLLSWTRDGQKILFRADEGAKGKPLAYIVVGSGKLEYVDLGVIKGIVRNVDISPVDARIVFDIDTSATELWKIDNLPSIWRTKQ